MTDNEWKAAARFMQQMVARTHQRIILGVYGCRVATCNSRNRKGRSLYKGVEWIPKANRWRARITVHQKRTSLGTFPTEEAAARAYDAAALRIHGEYARLNFPGCRGAA